MAFQSFQGRSCVTFVQAAMLKDFGELYPDYSISFSVLAPGDSLMDAVPVKSVTFMRPRMANDRADQYWLGKRFDELRYEITVRAQKRGGILTSYKDLKKILPAGQEGFVEFDGQDFEEVKADVIFGRKRRMVGVFGSGQDAGLIDVSDCVTRDASGHPTFDSIASEANKLMEEFYSGIAP